MKIELQEGSNEKKADIRFPCLAKFNDQRSESHGVVMLFVSNNEAIAVTGVNGAIHIGEFHRWYPIQDNCWQILPPGTSVTFTQE